MADEDDEAFGGMYEDGHWVWDEQTEALLFISDLPPVNVDTVQMTTKAPTGAIEFRDDVDLIEQLRYKRRYQRKLIPGQADVITLQDVKDIALYTAPLCILSVQLINMLHLPTTERFLRALIFCCAYYIQISDIMTSRILELDSKVRTLHSEILENEFRENLADLRVLVAKEYCIMLIGGGDMRKFHHMGPLKKRRSLSDKDARLFETFVRIAIQIVYLALGRRSFQQIELECHRIFKSEIFNSAEHTLRSGYIAQMLPEEQAVLLGPCLHHDKKLNTRSPLMNEIFCQRPIDYRLLGLGVIKYSKITDRLRYLYLIVAGPEEMLMKSVISVGIIGMTRSNFDTMLRPISRPIEGKSKASGLASVTSQGASSKSVSGQTARKSIQALQRFYPEIILPPKDFKEVSVPSDFPQKNEDIPPINAIQLRRWKNRFIRLTNPQPHRR